MTQRTLGNIYLHSLLYYKRYDQRHRWIARWKSTYSKIRKGLEFRSFYAYGSMLPSQLVDVLAQPEIPLLWSLWRLSNVVLIINSISGSPPSPEGGEWGWNFQASDQGLGLSFGQPSTRSPLGVIPLEQKMLLIPRIFQGFRSCVSGTRIKDQIWEWKMILVPLLLHCYQEMTRISGALGQELGTETNTCFS